jgi:valyl-tRNA synthetase
MPFITEEIWQNLLKRLPREGSLPESIMVSPYPLAGGSRLDAQAEREISLVMQAIRAVRNARAQLRIPAGQRLEALVETNGLQNAIEGEADVIRALSRVEPLRILSGDSAQDHSARGISLVVNPLVVRLPLEGVVDLAAEAQRLREERDDCQRNLDRVSALVSNPKFRAKARPDVVENEEARLKSLEERRHRLDEILEQLGE